MKQFLFSMVVLAAIALIPTSAKAQTSTNAGANIVAPVTIDAVSTHLHFGTVVRSSAAGTVVLATDNSRSQTGGVTLSTAGTPATAASYTVSGDGTLTYAITLPAGTITLTDGGSGTMTVGTFTSNKSSNAGTLSGGSDTFAVGATLNVQANQAPGNYTGTFNVSIAYN